jgi:hypothetical protein
MTSAPSRTRLRALPEGQIPPKHNTDHPNLGLNRCELIAGPKNETLLGLEVEFAIFTGGGPIGADQNSAVVTAPSRLFSLTAIPTRT